MSELEATRQLQRQLQPLQIISAALIAGVSVFAVVALLVGPIAAPGPGTAGSGTISMPMMMRMIWAVLLLAQGPMVLVIRNTMINRAAAIRRNDEPMMRSQRAAGAAPASHVHQPTLAMFRNANIISMALLESVALMGALAVMFSAELTDLALVGVPVLGMIALFPTAGRWQNFNRAVEERSVIPNR